MFTKAELISVSPGSRNLSLILFFILSSQWTGALLKDIMCPIKAKNIPSTIQMRAPEGQDSAPTPFYFSV